MNSRKRRYIKREVKSLVTLSVEQQEKTIGQQSKDQVRPPIQFLHKLIRIVTIIGTTVGVLWGLYIALPSWSLILPSASYRPRNPFTAVFTLTNSGGLPGTAVQVECFQNYIHYTDPIQSFSSNLQSKATDLGTTERNESRTFSCPQVVSDITIIPRVLTPEEIKQMYQASLQSLNETGQPPGEDMPFDWADFEFRIKYSPWMLPIRWTKRYRVVGKPAEGGSFVWQQIATDYQFEPSH